MPVPLDLAKHMHPVVQFLVVVVLPMALGAGWLWLHLGGVNDQDETNGR